MCVCVCVCVCVCMLTRIPDRKTATIFSINNFRLSAIRKSIVMVSLTLHKNVRITFFTAPGTLFSGLCEYFPSMYDTLDKGS